MGGLSSNEIEKYFSVHLPYRNRVLTAHMILCGKGPYRGDKAILEACFEASLITGRIYLNVLGVRRDGDRLVQKDRFWTDDINAEHLGGTFVDVKNLPAPDTELFVGFLKMADKGAAHLTLPMEHSWKRTHEAIRRIIYYLRENLYSPTNHVLKLAVSDEDN